MELAKEEEYICCMHRARRNLIRAQLQSSLPSKSKFLYISIARDFYTR